MMENRKQSYSGLHLRRDRHNKSPFLLIMSLISVTNLILLNDFGQIKLERSPTN